MRRAHGGTLLLFAALLVACSESHQRDVLEIRNPSIQKTGAAGPTRGAARDGGNGGHASLRDAAESADAANESDAARPTRPLDAGPDMVTNPVAMPAHDGTEVWIGQLRSTGPALCDPAMPGNDTSTVALSMDYVERVVLILENVDSDAGTLGGRIRLGEGDPPPTDPGDAPYQSSDSGSYWFCSNQEPTRGVEYALHDAAIDPDRLIFSITPSEVWSAWCATQHSECARTECPGDPPCECTDGACKVRQPGARPGRTLSGREFSHFDLAITADTLEGKPFGAELRLTRKR